MAKSGQVDGNIVVGETGQVGQAQILDIDTGTIIHSTQGRRLINAIGVSTTTTIDVGGISATNPAKLIWLRARDINNNPATIVPVLNSLAQIAATEFLHTHSKTGPLCTTVAVVPELNVTMNVDYLIAG